MLSLSLRLPPPSLKIAVQLWAKTLILLRQADSTFNLVAV